MSTASAGTDAWTALNSTGESSRAISRLLFAAAASRSSTCLRKAAVCCVRSAGATSVESTSLDRSLLALASCVSSWRSSA